MMEAQNETTSADFLGYRFMLSKTNEMMRLVKPKSKQKLRSSLKPLVRRCNGKSIEKICQTINPRLKGWYGYFKNARGTELQSIDQWVRMRLRSILRQRIGLRGRGRGNDHHRWPNRYFTAIGLFCLEDAKAAEIASLCNGVKCLLESRMRETRTYGSEGERRKPMRRSYPY